MKRLIQNLCFAIPWCFVVSSVMTLGVARAGEQEEVVAVCHFETGDFSFANSQTATSLAEVVQIELQSVANVAWVERKQVDETIAELGLGFSNSGNGLQLGSLLKADMLIKGIFKPMPNKKYWTFELEFIDLDRADVLSRHLFSFGKSASEKMPVTAKLTKQIVEVVRKELPRVIQARNRLAEKILIATLHFQNVHKNGRLDFLEQDLKRGFAERNSDSSRHRYLQFPRPRDAQQEADLIASGIVQADLDSWQRIGDHYFWGEYQEVDSSGVDFDDVKIDFTIRHWDGGENNGKVTVRGTVGGKKDLIVRIINKVESIASKKQLEGVNDQTRETIAEQIYSQYERQALLTLQPEYRNSSEISSRWLRLWERAKRRLFLASFFDPNNEKICRELLVETTRDDVPYHQLPARQNFWRQLERDQAWDSYCKNFGFEFEIQRVRRFKERPGMLSDNRVGAKYFTTHYLETLQDVIQVVHRELNPRRGESQATDVPNEVLKQWHGEFVQNYLARLKKVVRERPKHLHGTFGSRITKVLRYFDDTALKAELVKTIWPVYVADPGYTGERVAYRLKEICKELGKPEQAEAMLAEVSKGKKPRKRHPGQSPHVAKKSDKPAYCGKLSNVASVREMPTDSKSVAKWWFVANGVDAMTFGDKRVWAGFSGQRRDKKLSSGNAIFCWDQRKDKWQVYKTLNRNGAATTSMLYHDGYLWLTFLDEDVTRWESATGKSKRFSAREGTPTQKLNASCLAGNKLYFGGGESRTGALGSFDLETEKWAQYELGQYELRGKKYPVPSVKKLAGNPDWLAVYADNHGANNQLLLFEQDGEKRIDLGALLKKSNPEFSHFNSSWRPKVHGMAFVDQVLWIATSRGLLAFDPRPEKFIHIERLTYELTSMVHDGENVWFGACPYRGNGMLGDTAQLTCILQFDLPSKTWKTQIPIPYKGHLMHIARQGDTLWIAPGSRESTVVSVDVSALRGNDK